MRPKRHHLLRVMPRYCPYALVERRASCATRIICPAQRQDYPFFRVLEGLEAHAAASRFLERVAVSLACPMSGDHLHVQNIGLAAIWITCGV